MLAADLLVLLGCTALFAGGALAIRALWRRRSPEARGTENAREESAEHARRCHFCQESIDPTIDLFITPYWYHRTCNRNEGKQ